MLALFVVPESPATKCGDRLLAVDGHSLGCVPHSAAVTTDHAQADEHKIRVEVVSWMGTEL